MKNMKNIIWPAVLLLASTVGFAQNKQYNNDLKYERCHRQDDHRDKCGRNHDPYGHDGDGRYDNCRGQYDGGNKYDGGYEKYGHDGHDGYGHDGYGHDGYGHDGYGHDGSGHREEPLDAAASSAS